MGATRRFMQVAQLVGVLVILAVVAGAGAVLYLWWDSERESVSYEVDSETEEAEAVSETA